MVAFDIWFGSFAQGVALEERVHLFVPILPPDEEILNSGCE
jgi:hypothetical protein